ncbi:winged helix-turn-helix domain-containing protein [Granulicella paludicola]|uniref:winged helix-turn-helix domain-containing protein n=1 Tax=Granulicella paludicola TaxID=474951 RepID=UPI0021DFEAF8|nr:winged helix-turn-helix domain-containing protein [Granulicella paludicola]
MTAPQPARRYRFGIFEADASAGELRRKGIRVKLTAQPFQLLSLLLEHPGQILSREEISRELWPDGTFVDYEHGVNSAINRIREALGDTASNPRFVETLARRGYRFVAPVEQIGAPTPNPAPETTSPNPSEIGLLDRVLASPDELPAASHKVVQTLFLSLQGMYLAFYVGALANLAEISDILSSLQRSSQLLSLLIATAAVMIPVRAFVLSATLFHAPRAREKFLKMWPFLLPADLLWSLSPFLLIHHISAGLALACTAILVYSPFAQRSLVLMGACGPYE